MITQDPNALNRKQHRPLWFFTVLCVAVAWVVTFGLCGSYEVARLRLALSSPGGGLAWFADWNIDTTFCFLVLFGLPLIVATSPLAQSREIIRRRFRTIACEEVVSRSSPTSAWAVAGGLFFLSFLCSASIGMRPVVVNGASGTQLAAAVPFYSLPPAYHDEFSYLLQSESFLAGRVAWPPMPVRPDLFHQIHVINVPTVASRYFPWTGTWMAPFVWLGVPFLGHWIAGAIACVCFYFCLLKLIPSSYALAGGLLIGVSPGLAAFSNLLLAHHPTMLALSFFLLFFLSLMETGSARHSALAGLSLTLAMLGRPMTAAGFAAPFGIWLTFRILKSLWNTDTSLSEPPMRIRLILIMSVPLLLGLLVLGYMNQRITGHWTVSAYQHYTDTWTPSHRYGFNNAETGRELSGAPVLQRYDHWASNLTPRKAVENAKHRIIASAQWTLGIGAILFFVIAALPRCLPLLNGDIRLVLLLGSVISLHVVHIPYWYDGIMHWHYVFETAPLLLILTAVGLWNTGTVLQILGRPRLTQVWLLAFIAASLVPNWIDAEPLWGTSRVSMAISEQSFSRVRLEQFHRITHSDLVQHPCLVLVDERSSDQQLSYIINPPDYSSDVLVCRRPNSMDEIRDLQRQFADRSLYEFNPESFELRQLVETAQRP